MKRPHGSKPLSDTNYWLWRLREERRALLFGLAVAAFLVGVVAYGLRQAKEAPETVEAVVVRFGISSEYEGNNPLVIVRTANGRVRQLSTHPSKLIGCTPGAPIKLARRGAILTVHRDGCSRPVSPH